MSSPSSRDLSLLEKTNLFLAKCQTIKKKKTLFQCHKHELRREKTGLRGFRPGPTQVRHKPVCTVIEKGYMLEISDFKKKRDCPICIAKTKALISCAVTVTAQLICPFGFAHADCWFSHEAAQMPIDIFSYHNIA